MQLTASSSALLTSLVLALTSQDVLAAPFQGPGANTVTLSLGRREPAPLHPQLRLQQRIVRNQRRMARIAGRALPTTVANTPTDVTSNSNSTSTPLASSSTGAPVAAISAATTDATTSSGVASGTPVTDAAVPSAAILSTAISSEAVSSTAVSSTVPLNATSSAITPNATDAAVPIASQIPPTAAPAPAPPAANPIPPAVAAAPITNQIPAVVPAAPAGGAYLVIPGAALKKAGFKVIDPAAMTPGQRVSHLHKALASKILSHKHHHDGGDDDGNNGDESDDDNADDNGDDSGNDSGNEDDDDNGDDSGDNSGDDGDDDDDTSTSTKPGPVETVTNSTAPTLANSLAVDIEANDLGYFATVMIGTPPKPYRVTIDSGSSDFWVEGADCKAQNGDACASDHAFLSEETSSSFVNSHIPWNITYGSGAVSGDVVTDDVVIDGLSLPGHTFGTANRETSDFSAFAIPYDGLMGLGLSSGSDQGVPNPVDALAAKGLIKDAVTSYKISRAADGKHDGEITFGGMDPSKFDANTLVTIPVVGKDAFWETDMDAIGLLGGQTLKSRKRTAIHDTGTTGIVAPTKDADELHKLIPGAKSDGQGGYTLPCTTNATIVLTFGGKAFPIDPRDLSEGGPVKDDDPTGECFSAISGDVDGDDSANQWLLGDTFLKNVYLSTRATGNSTGEVSLAQLV